MKKLLRLLARSGINIVNPIGSRREYIVPRVGQANSDFSKVMGDMRNVGDDLRKNVNRELSTYGK